MLADLIFYVCARHYLGIMLGTVPIYLVFTSIFLFAPVLEREVWSLLRV